MSLQPWYVVSHGGAILARTTKEQKENCPSCGAEVGPEDVDCPSCGVDLGTERAKEELLLRREEESLREEELTRTRAGSGFWMSRDDEELRNLRTNLHRLYAVAFIVVIILFPTLLGLSMEPLYIPIVPVFVALFLLGIAVAVERRAFFMGGVLREPLDQDRLALLKKGKKQAGNAYALGTLGLIISLVLLFVPAVNDIMSQEVEIELDNLPAGTPADSVPFMVDDTLGVTTVEGVNVESEGDLYADVVAGGDVISFARAGEEGEVVVEGVPVGDGMGWEVPLDDGDLERGGGYSLRVQMPQELLDDYSRNGTEHVTKATVKVDRNVNQFFLQLMLVFSIIHLAICGVWSAVLARRHKELERSYQGRMDNITAEYRRAKYRLEDVFLVYRDGSLVAHRARKTGDEADNDIFMGMLTAVQDFVKDSLRSRGKAGLDEIKYGQMRILMERGDYLFLAVVLSGETPRKLRGHMKETLKFLHDRYADRLSSWDGNLDDMRFTRKVVDDLFVEEYASSFQGPIVKDENEWYDRGVVLMSLGRFEEAVECFEEALRVNPRIPALWIVKASALARTGEYHSALRSLEAALQFEPRNKKAKELTAQYRAEIARSQLKARPCPHCGTPVRYEARYKSYYCDSCARYVTKKKKTRKNKMNKKRKGKEKSGAGDRGGRSGVGRRGGVEGA